MYILASSTNFPLDAHGLRVYIMYCGLVEVRTAFREGCLYPGCIQIMNILWGSSMSSLAKTYNCEAEFCWMEWMLSHLFTDSYVLFSIHLCFQTHFQVIIDGIKYKYNEISTAIIWHSVLTLAGLQGDGYLCVWEGGMRMNGYRIAFIMAENIT